MRISDWSSDVCSSDLPEWSYTLAGRYELPFTLGPSKIVLNGDYYWIKHYYAGIAKVPSYGVASANIEVTDIGGLPLSATFFMTNINDKFYLRNSNLIGISPGHSIGRASRRARVCQYV